MENGQKIKKITVVIFFAAAMIMISGLIIASFPDYTYCNSSYSDTCERLCMVTSEFPETEYPKEQAKPASAENRATIYPILITSIIVLGVLIFAMWQTFKNKKHI